MSRFLWRCGRPGCDVTRTGDETVDFAVVASSHDAIYHPEEPERREYYPHLEEVPETRGQHPDVVIIDDLPPSGPRSAETDKLLHDWYKSHVTEFNVPPPDEIPDPAVRCATWLYPAVVAALTVGVVYLSYRAVRR